jgi:hypothetical protein
MRGAEVARSQQFRKCTECYLYRNTCEVTRDHEGALAGPRFLMRVAELEVHPAGTADRREIAQDDFGLGYYNITKCRTEVCPEHIKITGNAHNPLREHVACRKYDPRPGPALRSPAAPKDAPKPRYEVAEHARGSMHAAITAGSPDRRPACAPDRGPGNGFCGPLR